MNSVKVRDQYQLTKWSAIINECKNSGLMVKDWLKANNIPKDRYYYWKRKLQDQAVSSIETSFVEVPMVAQVQDECLPALQDAPESDSIQSTSFIAATIRFHNSDIDLYNNVSPELLKSILEVIANA